MIFGLLTYFTGDNIGQDRFPFRQNSNFYYLTGTNVPGYYVSLQITKNNNKPFTTLFVPVPSPDYQIWNGFVMSNSELQKIYDVDEVIYTNQTTSYVDSLPSDTTVYTITSSVALPKVLSRFPINNSLLPSVIIKCMFIQHLINYILKYA